MTDDGVTRTQRPVVVQLENIERVYSGFPQVHALHPLSLEIREGDFLAIVGPSGSGKSTLLNILGLLDRPTSGRYKLRDTDVSHLSEAARASIRGRDIGFVFQMLQLLEARTASENVMLATAYQGETFRESEERVLTALDAVGLASKSETVVSRLSGGERQRVAIARAVASRPALLLCDEPTGNLDTSNSNEVLRVLKELNAWAVTIVLITHDLAVASGASRHIGIRDGFLSEISR